MLLMDIMEKWFVPRSTDKHMTIPNRDSLSALLFSFDSTNALYITGTNNATIKLVLELELEIVYLT